MDEAMKPKDGLDQIAKEAADKAQFEFNPDAWAAMEKKLDGDKKTPFAWWKIWGPMGLLAILFLILLLPKNDQENSIKNQNQEQQNTELNKKTPADNGVSKPILKDNNTGIISPRQSGQKTNIVSVPTQEVQESSKTTLVNQYESITVRKDTQADQEKLGELQTGKLQVSPGLRKTILRWNPLATVPEMTILPLELNSFIGKETPDSTPSFKRWMFSAVVSADMSATTISGFKKPGPLVGIIVEYFIKKDLSIQTGLAYGAKKYSALGSEYAPPYWAQGSYAITNIDANCRVIDIPLNIQKYFDTKNGNRFFIGTGLSSYLMLSEDYNYEYTYSHAGWPNDWQIKNQNQHYFGVLNISTGYERPLTEKLGLGLAPYLKLPLTGIGEGKVKLLSFGLNVALKLQ